MRSSMRDAIPAAIPASVPDRLMLVVLTVTSALLAVGIVLAPI